LGAGPRPLGLKEADPEAPTGHRLDLKGVYVPGQEVAPKAYPKQIAFNVIPHIDVFMEDGTTKEEWKMVAETKKIVDPAIKVTATCVRVPVFVDLLAEIQTDEPARLALLSGDSFASETIAKPIAAPPTADPTSSSADLYYEVDNHNLNLRPGQRVGVQLPTSKPETSLVVPGGAVLYDVYGNTWVYVESGEREYTRHRVTIRFVENDEAILASGPKVGTPVVVDGAAELFGTEFGAGK